MRTYDDLPPWCPDWCHGDHAGGVLEGNPIEDCQVHTGSEFGEILHDTVPPSGAVYYTRWPLRQTGISGWRVHLEQERGESGWDMETWAQLEMFSEECGKPERAELRMSPAELLALGRTLQRVAERALFAETIKH